MSTVVETQTVIEVIETPGRQGPPGPSRLANTVVHFPAASALSGHRAVVLNDLGQAIYADHRTLAHAGKILGVTLNAAAAGELIAIQTYGRLSEASWTWTLDAPVFVGADGLLTQSAPNTGFVVTVGFPLSATELFIDISMPIELI